MIPLRDSVPTRSRPVVTWALIGLNVWVFLYEVRLGPQLEAFVNTWAFVPERYFLLAEIDPSDWTGRYLPLVTCMFLHGGWTHLLGNMVYLWIFGDNVEDRLGHLRYLAFYLLSGVGAGLAHAHLYPDSVVPTLGASGAISGVLGGYLVLFPHARVLTLIPSSSSCSRSRRARDRRSSTCRFPTARVRDEGPRIAESAGAAGARGAGDVRLGGGGPPRGAEAERPGARGAGRAGTSRDRS